MSGRSSATHPSWGRDGLNLCEAGVAGTTFAPFKPVQTEEANLRKGHNPLSRAHARESNDRVGNRRACGELDE